MPTLRSLLVTLLLPVLVLPEGIVVCLHRLVGEPPPQSCCTKCCDSARDTATPPPLEMTSNDCASCCLALPSTERSLDSSAKDAKKSADAALASAAETIATAPCAIAPAPLRTCPMLARARTSAPPPLVLLALPLRL